MDSVLNTVMRFDEGLMSKKDWIYLQFKKGSNVEISTKNKVDFDRLINISIINDDLESLRY